MGLDDSIVSIGFIKADTVSTGFIKADTVNVSRLGQCFSNFFFSRIVLSQHQTCSRTSVAT